MPDSLKCPVCHKKTGRRAGQLGPKPAKIHKVVCEVCNLRWVVIGDPYARGIRDAINEGLEWTRRRNV